eukprot:TRINITY_DN27315_c0_g1_i1.p1 TRINITY_DN27315_c0_g1~~TRINITY_DN27315_c0_g1_i1.p1  ORF type:complete len:445 (-),score=77.61 TRINITY_DN27315_c0_g1_i1:129-1463(-)
MPPGGKGPHRDGFSKLPTIESGIHLNELSDEVPTSQQQIYNVENKACIWSPLRAGLSSRCYSSDDETELGGTAKHFSPAVLRQTSPGSVASSGRLFAEPAQTLLFLDWDDTIFPCTELFHRRGLPRRTRDWTSPVSAELSAELEPWRRALEEFLEAACALSDRCVIVTNSRSPWVTACIDQFAPSLKPFFERHRLDGRGPVVVYAADELREANGARRESGTEDSRKKCCASCESGLAALCCRPILQTWFGASNDTDATPAHGYVNKPFDLTQAKLQAMRREASRFYSQYPGQTWKNVLSLGDMRYEHEAVKALSAGRVPVQARERLRIKSIILPTAPDLGELTLQLRVWSLLLPVCARFDGELDMDLSMSSTPFEDLSAALQMPLLARLQPPCPYLELEAVGEISEPDCVDQQTIDEMLDELAVMLHDAVLCCPSKCFPSGVNL